LLIYRYTSLSEAFANEDRKLFERELKIDLGFALVFIVGIYSLFVRISSRIVQATLTIGDFSVFMAVTMRLQNTLANVVQGAVGIMEETLYISNLNEFFNISPRLVDRSTREDMPLFKGGIEIENLSFSYPGSHQSVLSDFSLRISPGETIAIVGENGAGKTTLVKLIARLYDPDEGHIRIDGTDIREVPLDLLYQQFSFVFQSFNRYEATVADNIAYGDVKAINNREQVVKAAEQAGVDDLIRAMPDQYDTMLGRMFGLYDLSAGQWQKIAIARAIIRDAAILILDEPTASLDARAEYQMFSQFRELADGRTTILISHRFSTISMADRIAVMDGGKIIEMGTHMELLNNDGLYAQLYSMQVRQLGL
jgi:ATP-binding cassette subfamily B protein